MRNNIWSCLYNGIYLDFVDILERNLIQSTLARDKKAELLNTNLEKGIYQHKLCSAIKKCGVSFNIWQKPDENGNSTDKYDWTSLMGTDKKKVLEKLPDTFPDFLPPDTVDTVTQIWKVFNINLEE